MARSNRGYDKKDGPAEKNLQSAEHSAKIYGYIEILFDIIKTIDSLR